MEELIKIFIGSIVVLLGFPIGNYLGKITKDELKSWQNWFKLIIFISLIGVVICLIIKNDVLLFSFLFIAAVTKGSLKR